MFLHCCVKVDLRWREVVTVRQTGPSRTELPGRSLDARVRVVVNGDVKMLMDPR